MADGPGMRWIGGFGPQWNEGAGGGNHPSAQTSAGPAAGTHRPRERLQAINQVMRGRRRCDDYLSGMTGTPSVGDATVRQRNACFEFVTSGSWLKPGGRGEISGGFRACRCWRRDEHRNAG